MEHRQVKTERKRGMYMEHRQVRTDREREVCMEHGQVKTERERGGGACMEMASVP